MRFLTLAVSILISLNVHAQCWDTDAANRSSTARIAKSAAVRQNALNDFMAPIHSRATLEQYHKMTPANANPLQVLSEDGRQRFLDSITFNESGITGYRYSDLEQELTPTQIARILTLFGVERNTSLFRKATVKTIKDQRLLSGSLTASFTGCDDGDEPTAPGDGGGGDSGGGGDGGYGSDPATPAPGPSAPQDYPGYICSSPGTCKASRDYICLKSC